MVTVANFTNQNMLKLQAAQSTAANSKSFKGGEDNKQGFVDHDLSYYQTIKHDEIVEKNTLKKRIQINWDKTTSIPLVHYPRGLGGAPDFTFFEFLQTAKFPFYLGGPILAGLFYAGVKKDNLKSAASAKTAAKHMAIGVGLYYVGSALSKFIVNKTVKLARGIDLNHPCAQAIPSKPTNTGGNRKLVEFHKIFESSEFTRFDLMYNQDGKTSNSINTRFIEIAPKYGVNKNSNDVDSTLKPLIKKTIIMSRAWQYALSALYVILGIGIANQTPWNKEAKSGFKELVQNGILNNKQPLKNKLHCAKIAVFDYMIKPFAESTGELWKGHNLASSIGGKSIIAGSGLATLAAIGLIVGKTTGKHHNYVLSQLNELDEVQK